MADAIENNMSKFDESTVEDATLSWFDELGYEVRHGEEISPEQPGAERESFNDVLLLERLRDVIERQHNRRPDVVVFVNGMPLCVIELKNPADEDATIWTAFNQLQTYKQQIPSLFTYNETLIVSDGLQARMGSLTANTEWFKPWRTIEGEKEAPPTVLELEVLIRGVFEKKRFLKLLRHYIVFEHDTDSDRLIKIIAGYHQFHAARQAIEATIEATGPTGDKRCGVVWHTQGVG